MKNLLTLNMIAGVLIFFVVNLLQPTHLLKLTPELLWFDLQ